MSFIPALEHLDGVISAVRKVGVFQLEEFRKTGPGRGSEKVLREYVSHVDLESENQLHGVLAGLIPEAGFYGEETVQERHLPLLWVVDPVDGTTNYLSGLSQWSISVALVQDHEPILGVVYQPYSGELFSAIKGGGLYFNGKLQEKRCALPMGDALIGTGFPFRSPHTEAAFFQCAAEVLHNSRGIRRLGSAALDLAYVAAGFLQGFWEVDLQPYDVAAAVLFLSETGCLFTDFFGEPYDFFTSRSLTAALPGVYERLREITGRNYLPLKGKQL